METKRKGAAATHDLAVTDLLSSVDSQNENVILPYQIQLDILIPCAAAIHKWLLLIPCLWSVHYNVNIKTFNINTEKIMNDYIDTTALLRYYIYP